MIEKQFMLREILTHGFQAVNRELRELRQAIELLAKTTVGGYHDIEGLKIQMAGFSEGLQELEQRMVVVEHHVSTQKLLVRHSVTVGVALAVIVAWTWLT